MNFITQYMLETTQICNTLDLKQIEQLVEHIEQTKRLKGRMFILGVGGSAGNASHMVNDLRKLCDIESYAPTDNVSELTARTNDEGFDTIFVEYLKNCKFTCCDTIFILSVGGGDKEKNVSVNLIKAIEYVKEKEGTVLGIVGKPDGYTAKNADAVVIVPSPNPDRITPHSESFQSVIWHCIVSHPLIKVNKTKW